MKCTDQLRLLSVKPLANGEGGEWRRGFFAGQHRLNSSVSFPGAPGPDDSTITAMITSLKRRRSMPDRA